jgi:multicomponent Na+:H+ antiporter subunit D
MSWEFWIPILLLFSSLIPGLFIFLLNENQIGMRTFLNMSGAMLKIVLVGLLFFGVARGSIFETRFGVLPGIDFVLRIDDISLLFASLSAILWFLTTIYAIGYLEHSPHRNRFFGFFSLCVTAAMGVAIAGNLFTFFVFYEFLTLMTYPLVIHRQSRVSLKAGNVYLVYTIIGGAILLLGVVWLHALIGTVEFRHGGILVGSEIEDRVQIAFIFALLMIGLSVKSALVPLHGWLPIAMVAPAPVSALLHAVAVVKAGAYGIVRVIYDIFGIEFASARGFLMPLAIVVAFTIIYGSVRALEQRDIKRRLAYSTVSQLSYIVLGACVLGPVATIGGLVHLVHQGLMKATLFFCAGNFSETLGVSKVDQLNGIGRRMPMTTGAFTVSALAMIGVPPLAGFVSKWHLSLGAAQAGEYWVIAVLGFSSLLNAAYFLPLVYAAWFKPPPRFWCEYHPYKKSETSWMLLVPTLSTMLLSVAAGVLAGSSYSPLELAKIVAEGIYLP